MGHCGGLLVLPLDLPIMLAIIPFQTKFFKKNPDMYMTIVWAYAINATTLINYVPNDLPVVSLQQTLGDTQNTDELSISLDPHHINEFIMSLDQPWNTYVFPTSLDHTHHFHDFVMQLDHMQLINYFITSLNLIQNLHDCLISLRQVQNILNLLTSLDNSLNGAFMPFTGHQITSNIFMILSYHYLNLVHSSHAFLIPFEHSQNCHGFFTSIKQVQHIHSSLASLDHARRSYIYATTPLCLTIML